MIKAWRVKVKRYWENTMFQFKKLSEAQGFIETYAEAIVHDDDRDEKMRDTEFVVIPVFDSPDEEEVADEES